MAKQVTHILEKLRDMPFEPGYIEMIEDLMDELLGCSRSWRHKVIPYADEE